ncbi:MAG TPA: AsmA-like C-terminal region-containing protein [Bacteroidia bacterium]|nr:AsmA-like C-terminal region-containing protein [Bacteroidia bacterium]
MTDTPAKPRIVRLLRYIFTGVFIACLTVILLSLIITFFYGKEVEKYVVEKINSRLAAKVSVGEINFSLLKSFPYASLEFSSVMASDALTSSMRTDTLFYADELSMKFNVLNVFRKNISIRKIEMRDGFIRMKVNEDGTDNFHLLKAGVDSSSSESVINLRQILLKNIRYKYINKKEKLLVSADINRATLSGKFSDEQFSLTAESDLFVNKILSGSEEFPGNRQANISLTADVNNSDGTFAISSAEIKTGEIVFDVTGQTKTTEEGSRYNFRIKTNQSRLEEFSSLLPAVSKKHFENFKYDGEAFFTADISGTTGRESKNEVKAEFKIRHGKVSHKKNLRPLENISVAGNYSFKKSGNKITASLSVSQFNATLDGKPMTADFRIDDFKNPFLSLNVAADINLEMFRQFLPMDTLASLSGNASINISYAGKISDAGNAEASLNKKIKASGTLTIRGMNFALKNNPLQFTSINGNFVFNDNVIEAMSFTGKISGTDFSMTGKIENLIPFLLLPNQPAAVEASLRSRNVNLDELLERGNAASDDTTYKLSFSPGLSCAMKVDIDKLNFRKFKSQHISGVLKLRDKILSSDGLMFSSMKGTVNLSGTIDATRHDSLFMSYTAKIKGLDIHELFYECENFRQQTLTDKNLRGITDIVMQFASRWSSALIINPKSVVVDGSVKIFNGELHDFAPILALSRFIKVSELQHVKFSGLQNRIQIYDRKIFIPSMEIKSSALNLTASGSHTFDNKVDYSLKLLLSDVLGKKAKENNTEFGVVEDDGLGRASLFLHMTGDASNPKFAYDKKAVMKKIQTDIKTEKQTLKDLLRKEFGTKKDSTATPKKESKKEAVEIEWDED